MSQFIEMFGNQDVNDRSWNESIVKDEFTLTMGKTPARNNPAYWQSGTNKWISISDMARYGRYTGDTQETITDIAVAESGIKIVPKGTIIMSFKLSIGRTAVTSEDIYTNEAIMAFRNVDEAKFNMTFLQFLIANKNWLLNAKQAVKGQTLNKESIGNARMIVPPIELQEQFAAIYNQADKSGFDGCKSQFIEMFGDPVSWQTDSSLPTLNDTVNVISGFPFDSEKFNADGVGIPLIRIRDIQRGYSETFTTEAFDEQYRIKKYELLVGMDGMFDIARWQSDEAALNQRVCCLRMKGSENDTFIQYLVQPILKHIENGTNATTVKHISTKQINGIRVPIASHEQKNKFAMIAHQADKSGSGTMFRLAS